MPLQNATKSRFWTHHKPFWWAKIVPTTNRCPNRCMYTVTSNSTPIFLRSRRPPLQASTGTSSPASSSPGATSSSTPGWCRRPGPVTPPAPTRARSDPSQGFVKFWTHLCEGEGFFNLGSLFFCFFFRTSCFPPVFHLLIFVLGEGGGEVVSNPSSCWFTSLNSFTLYVSVSCCLYRSNCFYFILYKQNSPFSSKLCS